MNTITIIQHLNKTNVEFVIIVALLAAEVLVLIVLFVFPPNTISFKQCNVLMLVQQMNISFITHSLHRMNAGSVTQVVLLALLVQLLIVFSVQLLKNIKLKQTYV